MVLQPSQILQTNPFWNYFLYIYYYYYFFTIFFLFSGQRSEAKVNESLNDSELSISNWVHSLLNFIGSELTILQIYQNLDWGNKVGREKMSKNGPEVVDQNQKNEKKLKTNGRKYGTKNGAASIFKMKLSSSIWRSSSSAVWTIVRVDGRSRRRSFISIVVSFHDFKWRFPLIDVT